MDVGPEELAAAGQALRTEVWQQAMQWAAIPEARMRAAAVVLGLQQVGASHGAWILEWLIRGVRLGQAPCVLVYSALLDPDPLQADLGLAHLNQLLVAAEDNACIGAMQWLSAMCASPPDDATDVGRLVHHALRQLTLGERRAMARKARGDQLIRLLVDPDPGVIGNVLNNPHTTESTVLAICAHRPTPSAALVCVIRAPRWIQQHQVKLALVNNPCLALRFSVPLLITLRRREVTSVRDDGTLSPLLRLAAQHILTLEGGTND